MGKFKTAFCLAVFAQILIAVGTSSMLFAQDDMDALMGIKKKVDAGFVREQLKSVHTLLTVECFKDAKDPKRPGARIPDLDKEAEKRAEGIKLLDEIEANEGLGDELLVEICQLRLLQYSKVDRDTLKYEEYANKLLQMKSCPPEVREEAEAKIAALGSPWNIYQAYYVYCLPEDLINRRKETYKAYIQKKLERSSFEKNPEIGIDYYGMGCTYWEEGENEKAEAYFLKLAAQKDVPGSKVEIKYIADAMVFLASIELRRGNREKALQYCKDLLAKKYKGIDNSRICYSVPGVHAQKAVYHWKEDYSPNLDNMKLPYFTDCKPYPAPKEPEYTDSYVQLKSVRLEGGKGIGQNHALFRLIKVKFKRYGITVSDDASFTIKINTAKLPQTPDKPQGYCLDISDKEALISGNDYQGTVWGVVSFIQCVDPKSGKARICKVRDWPTTLRRGHSGYGDDLIEFGLFNKLNFFFNQTYYFLDGGLPEKEIIYENLKYMAKPFADFGLEFYVADRTFMFPKMCLTSDRTFQYHLKRDLKLASYGAHISVILDDCRYPLNPIDAKVDGGHAWKIDNQYTQKLYAAVKEKYPDVKITFCPVYYWGPHWKNEAYADTRSQYFEGIRTYLDPEIMVFWSGNQVKGYHKSREQVKWFTDSAKRKPTVWQNAMGNHWAMGYGCEVIPWTEWHYKGFFANDCEGLMANATFPTRAFELAHMASALWDPDAYRESDENREHSLQRSTDQLCGQGVYGLLRPGTDALKYMDKYLWSNGIVLNQNSFAESRDEVEELLEKADGGMQKALEICPMALKYSGHYWAPLGTMRNLLKQFDNPSSYYDLPEYKSGIGENIKVAQQEANLNIADDIFGNAFDFQIGKPEVVDKRVCVRYYPKSPSQKGVWAFKLPDVLGEYSLKICGRLAQEGEEKPVIRITLNKAELYKGPAKFTHDAWGFMDFNIGMGTAELTETKNELAIENITPRPKWSKPLSYYINYAIIKQKGGGKVDGGVGLPDAGLLE